MTGAGCNFAAGGVEMALELLERIEMFFNRRGGRFHSRILFLSCLICAGAVPIFASAGPSCEVRLTVPGGRAAVDERARWITEVLTRDAPNFARADDFAKRVMRDSPRQRELWIRAIAKAYPIAAVPPAGWRPHFAIAGKRILDRALLWIQEMDLKLEAATGGGPAGEEYLRMLKAQVELFGTRCTERDVALVLDRFQEYLREWNAAHPRQPKRSLLIGGSFVNGKWRPGSDIDVSFSDGGMFKDAPPVLTELVAHGLSEGCSPSLQPNQESAQFFGGLNPFVIEIGGESRKIHLWRPNPAGSSIYPNPSSGGVLNW